MLLVTGCWFDQRETSNKQQATSNKFLLWLILKRIW